MKRIITAPFRLINWLFTPPTVSITLFGLLALFSLLTDDDQAFWSALTIASIWMAAEWIDSRQRPPLSARSMTVHLAGGGGAGGKTRKRDDWIPPVGGSAGCGIGNDPSKQL